MICDSAEALKAYLHGEAHGKWVGVARPNMKGDAPMSLVFDCPLVISKTL